MQNVLAAGRRVHRFVSSGLAPEQQTSFRHYHAGKQIVVWPVAWRRCKAIEATEQVASDSAAPENRRSRVGNVHWLAAIPNASDSGGSGSDMPEVTSHAYAQFLQFAFCVVGSSHGLSSLPSRLGRCCGASLWLATCTPGAMRHQSLSSLLLVEVQHARSAAGRLSSSEWRRLRAGPVW